MVASPGHPELFVEKKKKMLKKVWSYTVDFCIRFRTIRDKRLVWRCRPFPILAHSEDWGKGRQRQTNKR